eukprot:COSAG01_NODE_271_length_19794_cov_73.630890_15_plen_68_part_00
MLLVRTLDADDNVNKMRALLLFSSYIENLAAEIYSKSATHSTCARLLLHILAMAQSSTERCRGLQHE